MFLPYDLGTTEEIQSSVEYSREVAHDLVTEYEGEPFLKVLPSKKNPISVRTLKEELRTYGFDCSFIGAIAIGIQIKVWNLYDGEFKKDEIPIFDGLNGGEILCKS